MGITQFKRYKIYAFINMAITRVKNGSPDMILTAFDWKFHEKKDELPPKACRPPNKLKKNNVDKVVHQKFEINNVAKVDPHKVEKKTMSKKWTPKKLKKLC